MDPTLSGGAAPPSGDPSSNEEVFVGREAELDRIDALLSRAIEGSGGVLFVTGDAGMGKTALLGELLRRARRRDPPLTVCRGRCVEQYGAGEAFLPFLDGLSSLLLGRVRERTLALLRTYAPTWCLQLPAASPPDAQEALRQQTIGATKERMLREMGDTLGAAAREFPVVLLLEDLQWADRSSVDLLRHLGERIARQGMLVVGTFRAGEIGSRPLKSCVLDMRRLPHCQEIALGPLLPEEIGCYLNQSFGPNCFPPDLSRLIHRRTEGHPLFVKSLVQLLVERGGIARREGRWALTRQVSEGEFEAPETVRSVIRRKLEALEEEDRLALQYASVMGREFVSSVLARLLSADEVALEERLHRLDRTHRLIEALREEELPDGTLATRYRFVHGLDQEVLYDDLVNKRRAMLHRQVGEQLLRHYKDQAPRIAAALALHFESGRDFAAAVTHLAQAGENAALLYAYSEAEHHLSHALGLLTKLPPAQQAERAALLYQRRGAVNHALGRFDLAASDYALMLEQARDVGAPALECAALAGLCSALFFARRVEEMAIRANEALTTAARSGEEALRVDTLLLVALLLQDNGNLADARSLLDEVLPVARRLHRRPALLDGLVYRASVDLWHSEYDRAEERLTEALDLASELRDGFTTLTILTLLGMCRGNLGRMSDALAALAKGVEMARENEDRFWLPRLVSEVGWIYRELQDFERAVHYHLESLRMSREPRVPWAPEADALLNLCVDYALAGLNEKAAEVLRELEAIPPQNVWFGWFFDIRRHRSLAEQWLVRGDPGRAREEGLRLLETSTRHEARNYVVAAHRLLAEAALGTGDLAEADAQVAMALGRLGSHPLTLEVWKTYALVGRLRSREGDRAGARDAHQQAALALWRIAAHLDDAAMRKAFLEAPAVREVLEGSDRPASGGRKA